MKNFTLKMISLALCSVWGHAQAEAENWMTNLRDDVYVQQLSIPGTHDSGTGEGFVSSSSTALHAPKTSACRNSGTAAYVLSTSGPRPYRRPRENATSRYSMASWRQKSASTRHCAKSADK